MALYVGCTRLRRHLANAGWSTLRSGFAFPGDAGTAKWCLAAPYRFNKPLWPKIEHDGSHA